MTCGYKHQPRVWGRSQSVQIHRYTARTPVEGRGLGRKKEASLFLGKVGKVSSGHPAKVIVKL